MISGKAIPAGNERRSTASMKENKLEQEVQQLRYQVKELEEKNKDLNKVED
jgi:hypothetical protein